MFLPEAMLLDEKSVVVLRMRFIRRNRNPLFCFGRHFILLALLQIVAIVDYVHEAIKSSQRDTKDATLKDLLL